MKAKAVVFTDRRQAEFQDVTVPEPGPTDVVVETHHSWISNGTEGSFLRGERINGETPYRPGDPWPFPIVAGYQSTGIVKSVGSDVAGVEPGQRVFCALGSVEGMFEPWGGHISPKVTDVTQVWPIPHGVPPIAVSGLVLAQVGYNCGTRAPSGPDTVALVIGDGLVGHWTAQTLRWRGAKVILAGRHDDRLKLFPEGDQSHRLNVQQDDLVKGAQRVASSGIDVLVDTVGSLDTVRACLPLMRGNGHIVSAGFHGADSMLDIQKLRFGELTLHSPSGWDRQRMDDTLALIADGHLDTESLITHRFPVERAAEAWQLILDRTDPVLGVVLTWT